MQTEYHKYHLLFWAPLPTQPTLLSKCYLTWKLHGWNLKQSTKWLFSRDDWDKKEACSVREEWIGNKNALVHKKKQSQSRVFDQKVGRFAKEQDEAFSIFHWSCVISSVTYPINHSFMLTDPGQLCKTFRTALVEWDSQAFTLGKHPEKHLKRCINILENYLSELGSKETEYGIKTIGICNQCYFNYFVLLFMYYKLIY